MGPDEYDVFLSYAGDDREEARALEDALRGAKVRGRPLRVFRDERSIGHHESITRKITEGVLRSAVLLAYYSRAYPTRPACQLELTFAFLLAQRSRTVRGRVLVVNPEDGSDHIEPVELRDLKYRRPPASEPERRRFAEEVAERVAALSGPLGAAASAAPPHWWPGEPLPDREAVHRYAELWRLHSALHAGASALVAPGPRMGVAVVSGLPGSGKTTLAAQYAQEFAAAFPGGVHWFTLDPRETGPDLLLDYRRLVRDMAVATGIPLAGVPDDRLLPHVAAHFRGRAEPALWIVDQLPAGISDETVRELLIPSRYVRTILTCQEDRFTDLGGPVRLGGLTEAEGLALLRDAYGPGEEAEAAALVRGLGGHPHDLRVAGAKLRTGRGMISLAEYRHQVAGTADNVLADILRELDIPAWTVLGLASFLAPAPLPRALLSRAAALLHGWSREETQERLLPALESLTRRCLVVAAGACVSVHARVLRAVPEPARRGCLPAVARAVAEHLTAPEPGPEVVAHARHLAPLEELPADVAEPLLSRLAAIDERASNLVSAARHARDLTARLREHHGDDAPRTRTAAARAALLLVTVADYAPAADLARLALTDPSSTPAHAAHPPSTPARAAGSPAAAPGEDAGEGPDEVRAAALHALAAALDGMGEYAEAEPYWCRLEELLPGMPASRADRMRVDRARALRQRGRLAAAAAVLAQVTAPDLPQRHLEEALLHGLTSRPGVARAAAEKALASFERAGLAQHPLAFEAAVALVDAELAAFAHRPAPFGKVDREQLARMRTLCEEYERTLGPSNPLTLSAQVSYGINLAGWQDAAAGRAVLEAADEQARTVLGELHPIRLRIRYGLSCAAMRAFDFPLAADLAGRAYDGQRLVLGERHPDTLKSLLQLGIARYNVRNGDGAGRDDAEARELISEARRGLSEVHGLWHDEVVRGYIAEVFGALPRPLFDGMMQATNLATAAPARLRRALKGLLGRE
ncbi:TIR domain-containing protein [Nonomuraea sp. LP-02]|uniref:TIR domain-containing protein n=1 Tax=Nonomuraea sp. LP-02 TaxID=3097960 RepID=UPI002E3725C7|nr:TIR domain-containing protein [Nonomuraea sp. LP-02]MED7925965.1 TIR domain-containing protein [Nonomuraea sp. LP-02]